MTQQGMTDLKANIGDLTTAIGQENAKIDSLAEQLVNVDNDADAEDMAQQIKALTAGINAKLAGVASAAPSGSVGLASPTTGTTTNPTPTPASGQGTVDPATVGTGVASVAGGA